MSTEEEHHNKPDPSFRARKDGFDDLRSSHRGIQCGIDENTTPLKQSEWKTCPATLLKRIRYQLTTHKPNTDEVLVWASISRILRVRAADLMKFYQKALRAEAASKPKKKKTK